MGLRIDDSVFKFARGCYKAPNPGLYICPGEVVRVGNISEPHNGWRLLANLRVLGHVLTAPDLTDDDICEIVDELVRMMYGDDDD